MGDGAQNRGRAPLDHSAQNYPLPSQGSRISPGQNQSTRSSMELERRPLQEGGYGYHRGPSPLNMEAMASALPSYTSPPNTYGQQHSLQQAYHATPGQGMYYQMPSMTPFAGQTGSATSQYPSFNPQQLPQHYQQTGQSRTSPYLPNVITSHQRGVFPEAQQQFSPIHQAQRSQGAYPQPFAHAGQPLTNVAMQMAPFGQSYPQQAGYNYLPGQAGRESYFLNVAQSGSMDNTTAPLQREGGPGISRQSSASSLGPSVPRGPPPKPRQSGHALWVGNLPPGTTIFDLKDHFSREATNDIESVFLISKSNCAFANYKTETACAAAMQRFNDTRFLGARLVCRLRRANPAPTSVSQSQAGTSAQSGPATQAKEEPEEPEAVEAAPAETIEQAEKEPETTASEQAPEPTTRVKEKFFIIKSLTVEDLELSVRNGIWATQAHNEANLNAAFEAAEDVYLIFSANKSGEYFGYARMTSSISEELAASLDFTPRSAVVQGIEPELPNKIPTPATTHAPRGYVIDDSARGTIFWEAESEEHEQEATETATEREDIAEPGPSMQHETTTQQTGETQSFGKPFRIEWVSTDKLPFYRTRGLRNPWNANREIKIARDGTELEPTVGRRLVNMFHRPQMTGPSNVPTGQAQVPQGYPAQQMMGFNPSMHPQQRYYQGH